MGCIVERTDNGTSAILQWPGSYEEEETVMKPPARQRNVFLLVCLLVMAISACLQFWIVKRIYQPIASIKETLSPISFAYPCLLCILGRLEKAYKKGKAGDYF